MTELLRNGLLRGRTLALAGGVPGAVREGLVDLGAHVEDLDATLDEADATEWARAHAPLHGLIYDAGRAFGQGGPSGLQAALEQGWTAIRAIATGALIEDSGGDGRGSATGDGGDSVPGEGGSGGKVILLAPRSDAGPHAEAARAALENLARTLSVEWARYGITTTAIAPGASTTESELVSVVGYLASPAGDYFSGCRLSLGEVEFSD